MKAPKQPASFRFSDEAHALLAELAERLGVQKVQILEAAIRVYREVIDEGIEAVVTKRAKK